LIGRKAGILLEGSLNPVIQHCMHDPVMGGALSGEHHITDIEGFPEETCVFSH
jgi:hypothetical protein